MAVRKICDGADCKKQPAFNFEGQTSGRFCAVHKLPGMVNVVSARCQMCAVLNPKFNFEGLRGQFCGTHRQPGMVDVRSPRCEEPSCMTRPLFNVEGQSRARFCDRHKEPGMVNVVSVRCQLCHKLPSFNFEGMKGGRFCADHKLPGMANVCCKRCEVPSCDRCPSYNFEGTKGARFCSEHKLDGMVDVLSAMCVTEACGKGASFNFPGQVPRFCVAHMQPGMINIKSRRCEACFKVPTFNFEGEPAGRFCTVHKLSGMVDVIPRLLCATGCGTRVDSSDCRRRGHCLRCFVNMFPHDPLVRNHKTKERAVADFVNTTFPDVSWTFDRPVEGGCSRRRPDIMADYGAFVLVVEVDENQHAHYDASCENKRTMQLFLDVGNRPLAIVRFNPDGFVDRSGNAVASCWGKSAVKELIHVKPRSLAQWNRRLAALKAAIAAASAEGARGKTIHETRLFFDEAAP